MLSNSWFARSSNTHQPAREILNDLSHREGFRL